MPSSTYEKGNQLKLRKVLWIASDYTKKLLFIIQKPKNSYLHFTAKNKNKNRKIVVIF